VAKVLVLDDDVVIAGMVADVVRFCGHEPIVETSSLDALVRLPADLGAAVVDYLMPRIDGLEVLAAIQERAPAARRILLTAAPSEQPVRDALRTGLVQMVIAKPPALHDLKYALGWL
jgi:two-component system response regulator FlrC